MIINRLSHIHAKRFLEFSMVYIALATFCSCALDGSQKEQIVGSWSLVSIEYDGVVSKTDGVNFTGLLVASEDHTWLFSENTEVRNSSTRGTWERNSESYILTSLPTNEATVAYISPQGNSLSFTTERGSFLFAGSLNKGQ